MQRDRKEDFGMNLSEKEIDRIKETLNEETLFENIINTSNASWDGVVDVIKVKKWLNNFKGDALGNEDVERLIALWLLSNFTYYTESDLKVLCRDGYNRFIHEVMCGQQSLAENATSVIIQILKETYFVGLGNPGESGMHILYYFRQANNIPNQCFKYNKKKRYKNMVLIDDMTISGDQALDYISETNVIADNIYCIFMFATSTATKKIEKQKTKNREKARIITTTFLDDRDRTFSEDSYAFTKSELKWVKPIAKVMCEYYGKKIVPVNMRNAPLGYNDGQFLIGFSHNIPDNTLPIFWSGENGWYPLFKRAHKIYRFEDYNTNEFYYY